MDDLDDIKITVVNNLLQSSAKREDRTAHQERMKSLYDQHIEHPDDHWKGRAVAKVAPEIAGEVEEAMNYMGSIVDSRRELKNGLVKLYSRGYWAHRF
ncbi:hypothetical protein CMI37_18020 [Candidatus Pacearchaeota archaeon]|nr:hypothetical protein [Candidatus Pacearchaeota archaeon]|tara:strand:+ start:529 stop:822 length:294 start_codon:yes stop_codon:yes gene_type:complete